MTLRNNGLTTTSTTTTSTASAAAATGSGAAASSQPIISHPQQQQHSQAASQASAAVNAGAASVSVGGPSAGMTMMSNTANINHATMPNEPNSAMGQYHFMGNNFSNENYSDAGTIQCLSGADRIDPVSGHGAKTTAAVASVAIGAPQTITMPSTIGPSRMSSLALGGSTIIHHPHYQNHNPKQFASAGGVGSATAIHNRSSSAILSSNSSNNNSSSTLDQMAIYEEIPDGDNKSVHGHGPLGDLTNLTDEERHKLEEIRNKRDTLKAEIQKLREEIFNVKKELSRIDSVSTGDLSSLGGGSGGGNVSSNIKNENHKIKKLQIGKKKFNMDPKKGIEFLFENSILEKTPQDVAAFLFKGEGLTKMSIGTYLGEKIDFNLAVLDAFVELHNFHNLHLVKALRQFLYSFRLPGEAQKIDRIMEKFAGHYCQHNEGVFNSADTCYVLCFSVIMLNTTLHNPNVKLKMSAEQFVNMNRGINNGDDLPQSLLLDLYESIRTEPFKMPEDDGFTFFNPDREGWLWKQGGRYKNWKRRWFLLSDKCLYYFENTNDKEPRGIIPLENIGVRDISERMSRPHCIELHSTNQSTNVIKACKTDTEGRVIEGRHTVYRLSAGTLQEKDAWLQSLKASVSKSPFYEMLAARKRKAQHN